MLNIKLKNGEWKKPLCPRKCPYGIPKYKNIILENLINIKEDGSFALNLDYFSFHYNHIMFSDKLIDLLKIYDLFNLIFSLMMFMKEYGG